MNRRLTARANPWPEWRDAPVGRGVGTVKLGFGYLTPIRIPDTSYPVSGSRRRFF